MVKLGVIGLSPGNGHPYSFSAIINGYSEADFAESEWLGILDYLSKKDSADIASLDARVTHVWTQHRELSQQIAKSCYIGNVVDSFVDMVGEIDAVLIARDDFEFHWDMAKPFLEVGVPVFIDKPLTLDVNELKQFSPYIKSGLLMSCSGFRFAQELDYLRLDRKGLEDVISIKASVINKWEKYGIHMVDALLGLKSYEPVSVEYKKHQCFDSYFIEMSSGEVYQIDCLGENVPTFTLSIFGANGSQTVSIRDNFTAFRRTLSRCVDQVKSGVPKVDVESCLTSLKILIAGRKSQEVGRKFFIKDLDLHEIDC